jgi:natural product precursor
VKKKVRKLSLNKETVRHLTNEELRGVAGGAPTHGNTCPSTCANTCPATCNAAECITTPIVCPGTDPSSTCSGPGCA